MASWDVVTSDAGPVLVALQVLGVTVGAMAFWWLVSLSTKDCSVADRWWGLGFLAAAIAAWQWTADRGPRFFVIAIVAAWAIRLAGHLFGRAQGGKPEDRRYAAMRKKHGKKWPLRSLFQVFILQGVLTWIIAAPMLAVLLWPAGPAFGWLDALGITVAVAGILIEGVADMQLQLFRNDPANQGHVMRSGLWTYSRHPNYFGEALVWWGIWLVAAAHGAWWTFFGPLLLTVLLLRVSGVTLLEKDLKHSKAGYEAYTKQTSSFVLWPPKK